MGEDLDFFPVSPVNVIVMLSFQSTPRWSWSYSSKVLCARASHRCYLRLPMYRGEMGSVLVFRNEIGSPNQTFLVDDLIRRSFAHQNINMNYFY